MFPATLDAENKFSVRREDIVTARCTDDGTPVGNFQVTGDYSAAPGMFWVETPPGKVWNVATFAVYVAGAGTVTANSYGPIPTLANGITLRVEDQAGAPLIPPFPLVVTSNGDYEAINFRQSVQDTGPGINHVTFVLSFLDNLSVPLELKSGQRFVVRPNDDLTALADHYFAVGGYQLSSP